MEHGGCDVHSLAWSCALSVCVDGPRWSRSRCRRPGGQPDTHAASDTCHASGRDRRTAVSVGVCRAGPPPAAPAPAVVGVAVGPRCGPGGGQGQRARGAARVPACTAVRCIRLYLPVKPRSSSLRASCSVRSSSVCAHAFEGRFTKF